jgi:uncharacterized protein (TIGR00661 family)
MKILYGVQGTGNGHISRASAMYEAFRAWPDIEITWLLSGRDRELGCGAIPDFEWRAGITFVAENGKINVLKTLRKNNLIQFRRDINNLSLADYDLIISDYEPVISHAARKHGLPVLGIGHQYAFSHKVPLRGENPVVMGIMQKFAPVTQPVGMHWHHFGFPILPPIVDIVIPDPCPLPVEDKVIVYLPFENLGTIARILQSNRDNQYFIYHPDAHHSDHNNLHFRAISRAGFKKDLLDAASVISNSGFELISECLQMGKRILTKPLQGQMEQLSNAEALHQLGYATVINNLDGKLLDNWLREKPAAMQVTYPDVAAALAKWIVDGRCESVPELADRLWSCCLVNGKPVPLPSASCKAA